MPLALEPSPGRLSSDAGLLPIPNANAVLQRETDGLLAEALGGCARARRAARQGDLPRAALPSRLFTIFSYQAGT
jgi:hypothetical protein